MGREYRKVKVKVKVKSLSPVRLFATPWTVAYQDPPSMGFSRQECWSGLPFPHEALTILAVNALIFVCVCASLSIVSDSW